MKHLSIGQMAKQNRVTEKALHLYHEKGILVPAYVDEETGRRYYDIQQSTKLDMILQLQQIGLSLSDIAEINEQQSMEYLQERICDQLVAIEAQQKELALAHHLCETIVDGCARYFDTPILDQITMEMLPERHILKFPTSDPEQLQATSGADNAEQWELQLRRVRQEIVDRGYPLSLFGSTGTIIPQASLEANAPAKEHIFVNVTDEFGDCYKEAEVLPGGQYLTLYLLRAYDHGRELDSERLMRMRDYAENKGLEVHGDSFGESLNRFPRFFDMGEHLLYRLCMPVRRPAAR